MLKAKTGLGQWRAVKLVVGPPTQGQFSLSREAAAAGRTKQGAEIPSAGIILIISLFSYLVL